MLHQFQAMTPDERIAWSDEICASVFDSPAWQKAQSVVLFSPLRTEPQIGPLEAGAVTSGKSTFIIPSTMGVETQLDLPFSPELILVPALAFSHSDTDSAAGEALTTGSCRDVAQAFKLGICFAFQLVETTIPIELHDAIMDAVISD